MGNESPAARSAAPRTVACQARRALMWKEWREQRWRFLLGTMVVTGLMAGLMRAQVISVREAALFVCWPVGIVMTIFLAMGPVASERADRTWEFLVAQPVKRSDVLLAKWLVGLLQLTAMMFIATAAGMLALWSRTRHYLPFQLGFEPSDMSEGWVHSLGVLHAYHPVLWLGCYGLVATMTLLSCFTPMFFILTRARNEFTAALGGILLVIVAHAWAFQVFVGGFQQPVLLVTGSLSPLSPLLLHPLTLQAWWPDTGARTAASIAMAFWPIHLLVWMVVPVRLVKRYAGKAVAA